MFKNMNIKKISLWLVIIMVSSFIIAGSILWVRGFSGTFFSSRSWDGAEKTVDTEKTFDAAGINNITIKTVSEDIKVIPSDNSDVKIHYYGWAADSRSIPELLAEQNGNVLDIELIHQNIIGINIGSSDLKLDIYVPRVYADSIEADTVSANLDIQGFKMDTLDFHSVSGNLSSYGIDTKNTILDTISGKMNIRNFTGNLEFKSVSGDIDVEYREFNNNINMHTVSGNMKLNLPDSSVFNVDFSSTSGDFNSTIPLTTKGTNDKHRFQGSIGNSSNSIWANSVSGDLEVY